MCFLIAFDSGGRLWYVYRLDLVNDVFDSVVDETEGTLYGGADGQLDDLDDDVIEDPHEDVQDRVHQPVGQDVAGETYAQATGGKLKEGFKDGRTKLNSRLCRYLALDESEF